MIYITGGLEEDTFHCVVQMCGFPGLDQVQEGQMIGRDKWIHWDAEQPQEVACGRRCKPSQTV